MPNYREVKDKLIKRQGGMCFYCGIKLLPGSHMDHIKPQSRGGSNDPNNLCVACPRCNECKSGFTLKVWLKRLSLLNDKGYVYWKKWDDEDRLYVIENLHSFL